MTMFKKIDHVEIVTDEPERSVGFYTRALGFEEKLRQHIPLPGGAGTLDIVYLDLGGTGIELLTYKGPPKAPAPKGLQLGYRLMALEVDDMKQSLDELKAKGVDASWGPVQIDDYSRAEILDPDGYSIELRQWHRPLRGRPHP
jgi:catechol 2,3-dioxygenase-like lactoylglutathione lyase family enzyme